MSYVSLGSHYWTVGMFIHPRFLLFSLFTYLFTPLLLLPHYSKQIPDSPCWEKFFWAWCLSTTPANTSVLRDKSISTACIGLAPCMVLYGISFPISGSVNIPLFCLSDINGCQAHPQPSEFQTQWEGDRVGALLFWKRYTYQLEFHLLGETQWSWETNGHSASDITLFLVYINNMLFQLVFFLATWMPGGKGRNIWNPPPRLLHPILFPGIDDQHTLFFNIAGRNI